jgi:hypothetical protein
MRHAKLRHVRGDPTDEADLEAIDVASFDAVVCLQPGSGSDADDSKLLLTLLVLQETLHGAGEAEGEAEGAHLPRLIGEVHSPQMLHLLGARWRGGTADFLQTNELASGILVQFALQPQLREVYSELLSPAGRELCMLPARSYGAPGETLPFGALAERARARGEVLIGIQRARDAKPTLNPPKGMRVTLGEADQLVIVGDSL